jgi:hypothetical protein
MEIEKIKVHNIYSSTYFIVFQNIKGVIISKIELGKLTLLAEQKVAVPVAIA